MMNFDFTVDPEVYRALLNVDVKRLSRYSARKIRAILPCLVRMSLIAPVDTTSKCTENRKEILTVLSSIEVVNSIVALLSIDFHGLEVDVKQEQNLRYIWFFRVWALVNSPEIYKFFFSPIPLQEEVRHRSRRQRISAVTRKWFSSGVRAERLHSSATVGVVRTTVYCESSERVSEKY